MPSREAPEETTLLQLLVAGAPAGDIAAAASDPRCRELALTLRASAELSRRREQELEVLVDTARDLASMRDPAGVLDAIVRRARALLRTDLAYLTLYDPERGDTFMRATAGSVAAAFQEVRLDLGAGLGGLAASTQKPYWTSDYMADTRFQHTGPIDTAVQDEGIVAICGTPLVVKDEFVGVLFAANRSRRLFTLAEVALLGSLAALAAVSIVQVNALAEADRALTALSEAHETVRRHTSGIERAAAAHDRFADLVLSGGGVDDITGALTELLGGWSVLLDREGARRSASGTVPADDLALTTGNPDGTGRIRRVGDHWVVAVRAVGELHGHLLVGGAGELEEPDQRTVERAAVVSALVLLLEHNRAEALRQLRTDLVADLVEGRGDPDTMALATRGQGVDLRAPFCVLVVRGAPSTIRPSLLLSVHAALGGAALVGEHSGDVVAVVPSGDPSALATEVAARLRRIGPVTVGASRAFVDGPGGVAAAHHEARRTTAALVALGRAGEGAALADLGFAGLVVGSSPDVAGFVDEVLGALVDYDTARGTELVATVEAWFEAGQSPRHAATRLHVHVNTVSQRLDRVGQILGPGWQRPDRALQVQLALHLRHLVDARTASTASTTALTPASSTMMPSCDAVGTAVSRRPGGASVPSRSGS